ncbi:hypothetical protein TIFTF001_018796 [Ficus carica]|uniref:Uncharacterized protein n=1 Tax=Ficus carica TaxID=3494 RepID=A0AA88AAG9_FICCA|nr:hypothetical protein TIFTF001_018796 [Ficus carica]
MADGRNGESKSTQQPLDCSLFEANLPRTPYPAPDKLKSTARGGLYFN